jgi:hypothetical protein
MPEIQGQWIVEDVPNLDQVWGKRVDKVKGET